MILMRFTVSRLVCVLVLGVGVVACGGSNDSGASTEVRQAGTTLGSANEGPAPWCDSDRMTLATALDVYAAMNPTGPGPTESDLVESGLIREESRGIDITNGVAMPSVGGPCA